MLVNLYGGLLVNTPEGGGVHNLYGGTVMEDITAPVAAGAGRWFNTNAHKIPGAFNIIVNPYNFRIDK